MKQFLKYSPLFPCWLYTRPLIIFRPLNNSFRKAINKSLLGSDPKIRLKPKSVSGSIKRPMGGVVFFRVFFILKYSKILSTPYLIKLSTLSLSISIEPVITVCGTGITPAFASSADNGSVLCRISNKNWAPSQVNNSLFCPTR